MFGAFLLVPQFAQAPAQAGYGFDATVTQAGLLVMPTAIAQLIAGVGAGRLGPMLGWRTILTAGAAFAASSFIVLVAAHNAAWEVVLANILLGVGIAFAFAATANLIVGAVPREQVGIATGINTVMRTIGMAVGSALSAAILAAGGGALPADHAYVVAFAVAAFITAGAVACAAGLPRDRAASAEPVPARA
jgi:MFS family permease